jgi:hypothetical protein
MRHAVGAFWVVARAITIPVRFFKQSFKRRRVALVYEQIAGPLPTQHVTCRVTPGCTTVALVAGEKIQKQARVVKPPLVLPAKPENISEKLFARLALHKNVLAGRMFIAKPRGNSHPFDSKSHDIVKKLCHLFR